MSQEFKKKRKRDECLSIFSVNEVLYYHISTEQIHFMQAKNNNKTLEVNLQVFVD
jgi:guanylate kinase